MYIAGEINRTKLLINERKTAILEIINCHMIYKNINQNPVSDVLREDDKSVHQYLKGW